MHLKIITSLLLLIPGTILFSGNFIFTVLLYTQHDKFYAYHFYNEKKHYGKDSVMSVALAGANLYYIYLFNFISLYAYIALAVGAFSFYFWSKGHKVKYDLNHSLWHIASVLIMACCIIG